MPAANTANWIRIRLLAALPIYGLLTFWATFTHEPERNTESKPTLGTSAQPAT